MRRLLNSDEAVTSLMVGAHVAQLLVPPLTLLLEALLETQTHML